MDFKGRGLTEGKVQEFTPGVPYQFGDGETDGIKIVPSFVSDIMCGFLIRGSVSTLQGLEVNLYIRILHLFL